MVRSSTSLQRDRRSDAQHSGFDSTAVDAFDPVDRFSVINWRTTADDVKRTITAVARVLAAMVPHL